MEDIRKISIGPDYKGGAMHYIVGQSVLNDSHVVHKILRNPGTGGIQVYLINKKEEVVLWKEFNASIPTSIEFNIDF
jgi:hypothetical protein